MIFLIFSGSFMKIRLIFLVRSTTLFKFLFTSFTFMVLYFFVFFFYFHVRNNKKYKIILKNKLNEKPVREIKNQNKLFFVFCFKKFFSLNCFLVIIFFNGFLSESAFLFEGRENWSLELVLF